MPSPALAKVRAHFDAIGTRKVHVPEWELDVYFSPVTLAERTRIYSGNTGDNDYGITIKILIEKARDAAGKPLFERDEDVSLLHHADSAVIIRLAAEIMSGGGSPPAAELKN